MSSITRSLSICGPIFSLFFLLLWIDMWKLPFVAFHVLFCLSWHCSCVIRQCLYSPKTPVSASTSSMLPFYVGFFFFPEGHFSHMQTPACVPLLDFILMGMNNSWVWRRWSLNFTHMSSSLQGHMPWVSSKHIPEHPKVYLLKPRIVILLFALFPLFRILNFAFSWQLPSPWPSHLQTVLSCL